jgi:glycosyltransferase involved in cell wall biosynthesis
MTWNKRPQVLVRAFQKVASKFPDATLTFIGPGPMRRPLESLVSELGLANKTLFTGYLREDKLSELYNRSSTFVLPSSGEGLSLALLEAMSFGMCIIVSESAASRVIRDGVDGLIFRLDDVDDLARKILWLFENPNESQRLSANARLKCEREYSMEVVAPKLEAIYARILAS